MNELKIDTSNLMSSKFPEGDIQLVFSLPWRQEGWKKADMDKLCEDFLASIPKDSFQIDVVNKYGREIIVVLSGLVVKASFPYGYLKD